MRYARGMFRLWLVLSCFWIATVAAITYSNWPSPALTEQASNPNTEYVPEYLKDQTNAFADFPREGAWSKGATNPTGHMFADALADFEQYERNTNVRVLALSAAKLALIPPALIFVVGIGLTWALRGFRPR